MRTIRRLYSIDIHDKTGDNKRFITKLSDKDLIRIHNIIINNNPNKKYFYYHAFPNHTWMVYSRNELKRKAGTSVIEYLQEATLDIKETDPKAEESSLRIPYRKVIRLVEEFMRLKQ